jgi:hypothetical protein
MTEHVNPRCLGEVLLSPYAGVLDSGQGAFWSSPAGYEIPE